MFICWQFVYPKLKENKKLYPTSKRETERVGTEIENIETECKYKEEQLERRKCETKCNPFLKHLVREIRIEIEMREERIRN